MKIFSSLSEELKSIRDDIRSVQYATRQPNHPHLKEVNEFLSQARISLEKAWAMAARAEIKK